MKKNVFGVVVFALFFLSSKAQSFVDNMNWLNTNYAPEKLHIHFDKTVYLSTETIYFKNYVVKNINEFPYSKTVYIDFFDTQFNLLGHFLIPLNESVAHGSFAIPADYEQPYIIVKSYTERMLKLDSAFVFYKKIPIINYNKNENAKLTTTRKSVEKIKIELFPEGGHYYENQSSKVAFKISNQLAFPKNLSVFLYNNKGKIVDTLLPLHDGMGYFDYIPHAQSVRDFILIQTGSQKDSFFMPQPLTIGADLAVENIDLAYNIVVHRTPIVPQAFKNYTLLATQNYQLLYSAKINMTIKDMVSFSIDKNEFQFPAGIIQFTLLNEANIPIEERIVFNFTDNYSFEPEIFFTSKNVSTFGKNDWNIIMDDKVFTNMSLSVSDANFPYDSFQSNMYSNILLEQDIKGKVYHPAFYFDPQNAARFFLIDLVMLTHGWRKYDYQKIIDSFDNLSFQNFDDEYLTISGKLIGQPSQKSKRTSFINVLLQNRNKNGNIYFLTVDSNDKFQIKDFYFFDTCKLYYFFNTNTNIDVSALNVAIDKKHIAINDLKPENKNRVKSKTWEDSINFSQLPYLKKLEDYYKGLKIENLDNVVVVAKPKTKIQQLDEKYSQGLFAGTAFSRNFDVESDPFAQFAPDLFTYIQTKVAGLQIAIDENGEKYFQWRGQKTLFYQNESEINPTFIQNLNVQSIAYLKIFQPPFFGSIQGGQGGAICIYTKKRAPDNDKKINPNTNYKTIIGYTSFKEFYNPSLEDLSNAYYPDKRTTLYWEPKVLTDSKVRSFNVSFFNAKNVTEFRIVLEGIDSEGRFTHIEKIIK